MSVLFIFAAPGLLQQSPSRPLHLPKPKISSPNPSVSFFLFPLLRREAARRPGVDGGDFGLQCGVDEAMARERSFRREQGGDDFGFKGLTAAALTIGRRKEQVSLFNSNQNCLDAQKARPL